jgi:effector-binding domain-containing protein
MAECTIDLRVGGAYRYLWHGPAGEVMGMRGEFREIAAPDRLVSTEAFDQRWYEGDATGTVTFVENGAKTTLTIAVEYASRAVRDAVLKTPMEQGVAAGFDVLDGVLAGVAGEGFIEPPQIVETRAIQVAKIHVTIPRAEIRAVMGPGIAEVRAALEAQGIEAAGPWLTHHLRMTPGEFDFEICVPVSRAVTPVGRVVPGEIPAATVARTIHHGSYGSLSAGWERLMAWVEAEGRKHGASLWEVYLTDPSTSPDPSTWRTELNRPLV